PIQIFEATTGRPVLSLLRPGKRPSGEEVEQILRHVIGRIRRNWPAVEIIVRGDSHFATPEVRDLLEERHCSYIFGLSTNARLTEIGRPWSEDVATGRALSKTEKMRRFFQTSYAAASWSKPRKVSPASRRASKAATYASSSPTCQAGQKSSTKRSTAHAGAWRISSRT